MRFPNELVLSNCPCCGSAKVKSLGEIKLQEPVLFGSITVKPVQKPKLWECGNCLSWFVSPIIPETEAIRLYSESSSAKRWKTPDFIEDKTPTTVANLKKWLKKGDRVLDIGCNTGQFLDFAKALGCETYGLEYSTESRAICSQKGHKMFGRQEETEGHTFDVITAFDLVEHLYQPKVFFNSWSNKLVQEGNFIVHTGNPESQGAKLSKADWWYVKLVEHLVVPSRRWYETDLGSYKVEEYIPIYANLYFDSLRKRPQLLKLSRLLPVVKQVFGPYTGIPALQPDHHLILLKKK